MLTSGRAGSFGKKFTKIALKEHNPKVILIYSRGELKQQQMRVQFQEFYNDKKLRFFIGDIRAYKRGLLFTQY